MELPEKRITQGRSRLRLQLIVPVVLLASLVVGCGLRGNSDSRIVYLQPEHNARWIQFKRPFALRAHQLGEVTTEFRKLLNLETVPPEAILTVRSLRQGSVFLDGKPIPASRTAIDNWKKPRSYPLDAYLSPGIHELRIVVRNQNGPAVLLAYSESLKLFTGDGWEAQQPQGNWSPALPVDEPMPSPELIGRFATSPEAIRQQAPVLLLLFSLVFVGTLLQSRNSARPMLFQQMSRFSLSVSHFRWGLIGLWILMSINSLWKVPSQGFDYPAHLEYITYMTEHHIPPLATDGWQMFQTPLYYFVSSAWYKVCAMFLNHEFSERLLRVVPLVCGLAQIEICFSALKYIFPRRNDLQCLGMLLGGLLPMNLYMSQNLGNEPLAGFFTAIAVVLGIRFLQDSSQAGSHRNHWLLGIVLGLAILTKVTAILLLVPLLAVLAFSLHHSGHKPVAILAGCLRILAGPFLITGWYFLRNWIELGKPYVGGWDPARKIIWWQDPGYRIAEQFTSFGESFIHPIYAAQHGFWDAMYSSFWLDGFLSGVADYDQRPPWNDSFLLCAPWLAILPTAAILLGGLAAIRHPDKNARRGMLFALASIGIYFAAVLALYVQLPIYSTAKATYTLGLTPCFAVLGAAGFDLMMRNTFLRAAVYAGMACWAVFAYLAYFAL